MHFVLEGMSAWADGNFKFITQNSMLFGVSNSKHSRYPCFICMCVCILYIYVYVHAYTQWPYRKGNKNPITFC